MCHLHLDVSPSHFRFRYDKSVEDIMTLQELEEYKNKAKDSTHDALQRTDGIINKKAGRATKILSVKKANEGLGKVDDIFSVSRSINASVGGIFTGEIAYCVVDSDFSLEDPVSKKIIRKYSREEVRIVRNTSAASSYLLRFFDYIFGIAIICLICKPQSRVKHMYSYT